jgi:NADPH:quinone reductase
MKALVYEKAHNLEVFGIKLAEVPEPSLRESDVLVDVHAVGINPGEAFIRKTRSAEPGGRVLLGWEFAGVVVETGTQVGGFKTGDRVFGTGEMSRDGAWAERLAVDHRIVAKCPNELSFSDAASLPVGAITAWEAMFRDQDTLPAAVERVLIIGGAGAVGSLATQLLKARTKASVVSTASRSDSQDWCRKMGSDLVIDHTKDIEKQLASAGIQHIDMVLSTANTADNLGWIAKVLRPFGHVCIVDISPSLDANTLMLKSASLHMEMAFSRTLHHANIQAQGEILKVVSGLVADGRMTAIASTRLDGLTPETMRSAHELVESRRTIGKIVIAI